MVSLVNRDWRPELLHAPPYETARTDSPIERRFLHECVKYVREGLDVLTQVDVNTLCGRFRLDFLIEADGRRVAFECDGREFHDAPQRRLDLWRDAAILGAHGADAIYRMSGQAIVTRPEDIFYAVARLDPPVIGGRGMAKLQVVASPEIRAYDFEADPDFIEVIYPERCDGPRRFKIERRTIDQHWDAEMRWKAIQITGGGSPEALEERGWQEIIREAEEREPGH